MRWALESVRTDAGFLEKSPVTFARGLTCIIGARGTCKSTLVETIRFAFNCDRARVDEMVAPPKSDGPAHRGLIRETLAGGMVRCELASVGGPVDTTRTMERTVGSGPRVFRDGVQEIDPAQALSHIEIFSQADLHRLAESPEKRLELIDRPRHAEVEAINTQRDRLAAELQKIGPGVRELRARIAPLAQMAANLEPYRRELATLAAGRAPLPARLEEERERFSHRKAAMDRVSAAEAKREQAVAGVEAIAAAGPLLREAAAASQETGGDPGRELAVAMLRAADAIDGAADLLRSVRDQDLSPLVEALKAEFNRQSEPYFALRKEQQEVNESLKKEESLRAEIERLERASAELDALTRQRDALLQQRRTLRAELDALAEQLYAMRVAEVNKINDEHSRVVVLALQQGSRSPQYLQTITELVRGSNLRGQDEVARDLAEKVLPGDLVDIVEAGDAKRLADGLGRDIGQMTRLLGHLVDNPKLYSIEGNAAPDLLEITLIDDGQAKPIAQLSKGQMATALLPLILRPAPYPLVIDQPEDDLDNRFIFRTLVSKIRELKAERQLIFVTHNANIPVLGEADRVVVMSMENPKRAAPAVAGTVDECKDAIIGLLEGGVEAFNLRQRRYGAALSAGTSRA